MPDVRGLSESEAREVIADSGLSDAKIKTKDQPSIAAKGTVIAQEPAAGADRAGTVTLTLAAPAEIPPVVGADVRAGVRDLQELGATVEVRRTYQAGAAVDTVLAVDPAVGKPVPPHVILTVAAPPAIAYLGDLSGTQGGCAAEAVSVNGVRYEHALRCAADVGRFTEAAYLLDRKTLRFDAVIGQPDTDAPGRTVQYAVVGDGKVMVSGVLRYGETRTLSLDTSGVLRLVLRVTAGSNTVGAAVASVAFGDARVTAGPADIAAVRTATP
jgi:hypothetical protein